MSTSVEVTQVDGSMLGDVLPLLEQFYPAVSEESWRRLFHPAWETGESHCGYGLLDGSKVVGFLGTLFSRRDIRGHRRRFCNLSAWAVLPEYRDHSLSLLLRVRKLTDCTLTDLSPSERVGAISRRLGFETLDARLRVLFPVPVRTGRLHGPRPRVVEETGELSELLTPAESTIVRDHAGLPGCHALVVARGDEHCLVLYTATTGVDRPYCHIQHASPRRAFARLSGFVRHEISARSGIGLHVVDARLVRGTKHPFSVELPCSLVSSKVRLFRSSELASDDVDNLYSEFVLWPMPTAGEFEHVMSRGLQALGRKVRRR